MADTPESPRTDAVRRVEEPADLAPYIDHTLLRPDARRAEVATLCAEAAEHGFAAVCVASRWVAEARHRLQGSPVAVCCVVGFPHGDASTAAKAAEAAAATGDGADELDMVISLGALKAGAYREVEQDIRAVVEAASGRLVKVILETCELDEREKAVACALSVAAGAGYVKTSTGFGKGGATVEDIQLMRSVVGADVGVKASGGIRDFATAKAMIDAGASRVGASRSVALIGR
ncbi:MAG: deoxyribose-phosphate aldolase [Sandaracinus sp.]|nr:deoxyribose-phosphate aldolase [Sandaracinus sp.]